MRARCPMCHQLLPERRAGVKLTPLKAQLFDVIDRAGYDGLSYADIGEFSFARRWKYDTIKAHIWQLNEALEETDFVIRSVGGRGSVHGFYRIERRPS